MELVGEPTTAVGKRMGRTVRMNGQPHHQSRGRPLGNQAGNPVEALDDRHGRNDTEGTGTAREAVANCDANPRLSKVEGQQDAGRRARRGQRLQRG